MSKRPTLRTVAEHAKVSLPTVSQVMRGVGRISPRTREKVLSAARELNYIPDDRAASMRSGQSREVGMIVHHLANAFNAELISGVSDTLETQDYLLSVLDARDSEMRLENHMKALLRRTRGGILWVPTYNTPPSMFKLIEDQKIPSVTFLRDGGNKDFPNISIANYEATYIATSYLIELGHTRIAYIGGGDTESQTRITRIKGYTQALQDHGITNTTELSTDDNKQAGFDVAQHLKQEHPSITAVLCNGDETAIGFCLGLQRLGLRAGEDISVIGFDDIIEAGLMTPALTTLSVKPYQFGCQLAKILLERIQNPSAEAITMQVKADLVIRETTKPTRL